MFVGIVSLFLSVSFFSNAFAAPKTLAERRKAKEVYINMTDEPPSMDPNKQADQISSAWLKHLFEGLMSYNQKNQVVLGSAEKYEISADKKTYTFTIRPAAKWHDGKPLTAQDFVFTFRRIVDPSYASTYAFLAETAGIVNAHDIYTKKKKPEELGVRAVDDKTFEVTLERPTPFFLSIMAFCIFYPVREDYVKKFGDKFATSMESIMGNGPFKMTSWVREQSMRIEKSMTYWNAKEIKLNAIESPTIIRDNQAAFNTFLTGGLDTANTLLPEIMKQAQDKKFGVKTYLEGCVNYLEVNTRKGFAFENKKLRQALRDGVNRKEFVNKILATPGFKTYAAIIPDYMPGSAPNKFYRKEVPFKVADQNLKQAKKLIQEYLKETGQAKVPTITFMSDNTSRAARYAEYFQAQLASLFGSEVKIENLPFKTRLQRMRDGKFDVVLAGWCPDYLDPMTFVDLLYSKNDNNHTGWKNEKYDALVVQAMSEMDGQKRNQIFSQIEQIAYDEAAMVVTDQTGGAYVSSSGLEGIVRPIFGGFYDLRFAYWK